MVSPAPPNSANAPLSYAERAKKAQNIKPRAAQPLSPLSPSATSPTAIAHTGNRAPPAPKPSSGPGPSHSLKTPHVTTEPSVSPSVPTASAPAPTTTTSPPAPLSPQPPRSKELNGHSEDTDPSASASPAVAPTKMASAPPVNVWNVRKEQMAQARALTQPPRTPQASSSSPSKSPQSAPQDSTPAATVPPDVPSIPSSSTLQSVTSPRPPVSISTISSNGPSPHANQDPFTVRPRAGQSSAVSAPPPVDDTESWPEVGKAPTPVVTQGSGDVRDREDSAQSESSEGRTSRKSEKTKWVPIPAHEMQAAVDALHPNRNHNHRPRPQQPRNYPAAPSGSASASSSASAQGSQIHSRNQSSSGIRHTASGSQGASIHSSPLRSGSKYIPEDSLSAAAPGTAAASRSISVRSSRVGSPTPPTHSTSSASGADVGTSRGPNGITPGEVSRQQEFGDNNQNHYPSHIPPPGQQYNASFPPSRASGSPVPGPYPLPPFTGPGYPPHPHAYPGAQPYPVYAPYPYAYSQPPYAYWGGHPASHSPGFPADGVPPPTMMARPPPPDESDAVTGYREVGFVMPAPASYVAPSENAAEGEQAGVRGRRPRELSFGSISAVAGKSQSPPAAATAEGEVGVLGLDTGIAALTLSEEPDGKEEGDKAFATFSIGVAPDEASSIRIRSRTRTGSKASRRGEGTAPRSASETTGPVPEADGEVAAVGAETANPDETLPATEVKVIDLTDSETKWEFGTTKRDNPDQETVESRAPQNSQFDAQPSRPDIHAGEAEQAAFPLASNALGVMPGPIPAHIPVGGPMPLSYPPAQGPAPILGYGAPTVAPLSLVTNGFQQFSPQYGPPSSLPSSSVTEPIPDEWKVKDYGYGFGRGGGYASASREDRYYRNERERDWDRRDYPQDREFNGRPRRGSYNAAHNYDRGGYSGRRARGVGGYGRGFYGRGSSRGAYAASQRQSPFTMSQPQPPHPQSDLNGYYAPIPPPAVTTYIPTYEPFGYQPFPPTPQSGQPMPPLPAPLSVLSFPLDPLRYRLLGQLEYYLSAQNMAQDLFLRRKMEAQGWIHIPLLATFNRVKALTMDIQLVKDVLSLSSQVEVSGDWVRMREWEQFILPNTAGTTPESHHTPTQPPQAETFAADEGETADHDGDVEGEGAEDEEEDVVFVLGTEANGSWTPERLQP